MDQTNWRNVAEALWNLLDDIDTAIDQFREPSANSPFGKKLYELLKKRHQWLQSDGYQLRPTEKL